MSRGEEPIGSVISTQLMSNVPRIQENDPLLTHVNLKSCGMNDIAMQLLADALQCNNVVQFMDLSSNEIGNDSAIVLAEAIQLNKSLRHLNLSNNKIGDDGVVAIANALQCNRTLEQLDLHFNSIGNIGATALAKALQKNCTLKRLYLVWFPDAANELVQTLEQYNDTLQHLQLPYNNLPQAHKLKMIDLTHANRNGTRRAPKKAEQSRLTTYTWLSSVWLMDYN